MLAKVIGVHRLTQDVELRYLPSGAAVAKFNVACSESFKDQAGNKKENVCFIEASVFGKLAEVANQYLQKGSKIYIVGSLKFEQWEAQDGTKRSKHVLKIESFDMLDPKPEGQGQQNNNQAPQQQNQYNAPNQGNGYNQAPQVPEQRIPEINITEDEIPF